MRARPVCTALIVPFTMAVAAAQTPASPANTPRFEVASVKVNTSGAGRFGMQTQPGGRYVASNVTLQQLVLNAYQLQNFQLVGGPGWMTTERFDITATADSRVADPFTNPPGGGPSPLQLMMRALLAERFHLTVRHETRELPLYALAMARSDGRLGPRLLRSTVDCAALSAALGRGVPIPVTSPDQRPMCGMRAGPGHLTAGAVTLAQLASVLSGTVNRTVLDRTGLTESFDVDLSWTPDQVAQRIGADEPAIDPNGPSIFTALQEQLGLKLESGTGPFEVLMIDHVERPTDD